MYVELYYYIKVYHGNSRVFLMYFIIHSHMNVIYDHAEVSRGFN